MAQSVVSSAETDFGKALRTLRQSRGLSLAAAASRGGISKATLGFWEAGSRQPRGPALVQLLDFYGVDDRTKARLLVRIDPQHARIALVDSPFCPHVEWGTILRTMRERRGVTQSDLARRLDVSQAAVSRWEAGDDVPSPEKIHALGFALGASAEETAALASASGSGGGSLPDDPRAALAQMRPHAVPYALREATFLGWEAELGRRAARDARWDAALVFALAERASWLTGEERHEEIAPVARRAIALVTGPETRIFAVPAIAALADADRRLRREYGSTAELAGEWSARLPDSQLRAWMVRQRGMNLIRMGRTLEGLDFVERSAQLDVEMTAHFLEDWAYVTSTLCEAYLEAGEPKRAAALLGDRLERSFHPGVLVRVGHAVGRAATRAEMAYLRAWNAEETPSRLNRRRQARIESRQAQLTGEPIDETTSSDAGKSEDLLWEEVRRERQG